MNPSRLVLPVVVFTVFLLATIAIRKSAATTVARFAELAASSTPPHRSKPHREESAFAEVRAYLRAGDLAGAKNTLSRLAERDPVAFFELLEKLPGIPGIDSIIRDAAGRLPWNRPEITALLNHIGPHDWRDLAWESYTAPQVGIRPDEEVYAVGTQAQIHVFTSGIQALLKDAAANRPDSFLAFLNRKGSYSIRVVLFEEIMKVHPDRVSELFHTIPDGVAGSTYDKAQILQSRARCLPTAANLLATLDDMGTRGNYNGEYGGLFASQAYQYATAEEREKVLEVIAAQPPLARNRLLAGPLLFGDKPLPLDEFNHVVELYTSGYLQDKALEHWFKNSPDLDTVDRSWIGKFPSARLQAKANELLDSRQIR